MFAIRKYKLKHSIATNDHVKYLQNNSNSAWGLGGIRYLEDGVMPVWIKWFVCRIKFFYTMLPKYLYAAIVNFNECDYTPVLSIEAHHYKKIITQPVNSPKYGPMILELTVRFHQLTRSLLLMVISLTMKSLLWFSCLFVSKFFCGFSKLDCLNLIFLTL